MKTGILIMLIIICICCRKSSPPEPDPKSYTHKLAGEHKWWGTHRYRTIDPPNIDTTYNVIDTFTISVINGSTIYLRYKTLHISVSNSSAQYISFRYEWVYPAAGHYEFDSLLFKYNVDSLYFYEHYDYNSITDLVYNGKL